MSFEDARIPNGRAEWGEMADDVRECVRGVFSAPTDVKAHLRERTLSVAEIFEKTENEGLPHFAPVETAEVVTIISPYNELGTCDPKLLANTLCSARAQRSKAAGGGALETAAIVYVRKGDEVTLETAHVMGAQAIELEDDEPATFFNQSLSYIMTNEITAPIQFTNAYTVFDNDGLEANSRRVLGASVSNGEDENVDDPALVCGAQMYFDGAGNYFGFDAPDVPESLTNRQYREFSLGRLATNFLHSAARAGGAGVRKHFSKNAKATTAGANMSLYIPLGHHQGIANKLADLDPVTDAIQGDLHLRDLLGECGVQAATSLQVSGAGYSVGEHIRSPLDILKMIGKPGWRRRRAIALGAHATTSMYEG